GGGAGARRRPAAVRPGQPDARPGPRLRDVLPLPGGRARLRGGGLLGRPDLGPALVRGGPARADGVGGGGGDPAGGADGRRPDARPGVGGERGAGAAGQGGAGVVAAGGGAGGGAAAGGDGAPAVHRGGEAGGGAVSFPDTWSKPDAPARALAGASGFDRLTGRTGPCAGRGMAEQSRPPRQYPYDTSLLRR